LLLLLLLLLWLLDTITVTDDAAAAAAGSKPGQSHEIPFKFSAIFILKIHVRELYYLLSSLSFIIVITADRNNRTPIIMAV